MGSTWFEVVTGMILTIVHMRKLFKDIKSDLHVLTGYTVVNLTDEDFGLRKHIFGRHFISLKIEALPFKCNY